MWTPGTVPAGDMHALQAYIAQEFQNLAQELSMNAFQFAQLAETFVAPQKPRDGLVVFADGTSWNPGGTGRGVYVYSSGVWVKL